MRILHILNDVTDLGNGIVNTAVDLAIAQERRGETVAIASAGGGYQALLEQHGVLHLQVDQSRNVGNILRALFLLRRHIRSFRPDVVHVHMRTGLLLAWLLSRFYRFPLVAHLHNVHDRESIVMGLAQRVIAVSGSVAVTIMENGIPREKIRVVLNRTIGTPRLPPLSTVAPAVLQKPAIVTVCGMNHRKGIAELISAFDIAAEKFPAAHLYLVGEGPQRELFEAQARMSPNQERIHFEGFQKLPQAYMLSTDIFVLASRRESLGLVLIEAREAGCAIVASDIDGIAEALDDGRAGLLVPPQNPSELANALCNLLGDEQVRHFYQRRARFGIEAFRVEVMASEIENIYHELTHRTAWIGSPDTALRD